jgi:hypothetical protein
MCSGCAGDYADDPDSDDSDDPMADAGDGAASGSFRGTGETLGDPDLGETDLAQGMGGGTAGLEAPDDSSEICEILVTGTQIVEIRVISANWRGQGRSNERSSERFWNTRAALAPRVPSKHSSGASAKYYQTRQGSEKTRGYAAYSLRISRSLAGVCKAKLNGWLQETRRLLRRCTPQSG